MTEKFDYYFKASISKDIYADKSQTCASISGDSKGKQLRKECGLKDKLCFKIQTLNSEQLLNKAIEGHTFCPLFGNFTTPPSRKTYIRKDGYFTMEGKCGEFFQGSYFIGVDIDNTKYTPTEFIGLLGLKPTLWYTSLSHLQTDKNEDGVLDSRFRLIYVFDSLIQDKYFFRYCATNLYAMIEDDTDEKIEDKCGLSCCQYFNGTNNHSDDINCEYGLTNLIYSLDDINISENGYLQFLEDKCGYSTLNKVQKKDIKERILTIRSQSDIIKSDTQQQQLISEWDKMANPSVEIEIDSKMLEDYKRYHSQNNWDKFFNNYIRKYPLVYRTEREDWNTIQIRDLVIKYQLCNENYLELAWIPLKKDDKGNPIKRRDGTHRRNTLFHRGWLRRAIKPDISPNELLFNLINDRERFFDNEDGLLSDEFLVDKVRQCFSQDIEEFIKDYQDIYNETKDKSRKKRLIIHWTSKNKIRPNSLTKELRWQLFDPLYDKNLTHSENFAIILNSDITEFDSGLSRSSFYRYCKERGFKTKGKPRNKRDKFIKLHQEGMSLHAEQAYLESNGLRISVSSIARFRKELESNYTKDETE